MPDYDVLVIGSGAGGLTAAVALARAGQRVLICEQHYVPGGWCHSFTLEGYRFSPGVHYIGRLEPGGSLRRTYEGLGVSEHIAFCEINPDGYDHIIVGDERFDIPKGRERYIDRLCVRFPREREGIQGFFAAVDTLHEELGRVARLRGPLDFARLPWLAPMLLRWGWRSGGDLIDHFVSDPFLKAILGGQSGDHGLPPSQVSAVIHSGIIHHYLEGAYYPLGGGFAIPRAFIRALKAAGGEIRLSTPVASILLEGDRAVGVRLTDGQEIRAGTVISNADPHMTYSRLIGPDRLPWRLRRKLDRARYSTSALSLFMAVDMDLRAAGLDSGNFWFYSHADLDAIYGQGLTDHVVRTGDVPALFLTATTLKDPSKMHSGHHTLEAFTFVDYAPFAAWADQAQGGRDEAYRALKARLADRMLAQVERLVPGFRDRLVFCDLGTPLSNAHYLAAHRGNLYGTDKGRFQVGPLAFPVRTPFRHLYQVGASTLSHGVSGATSSGLAAARATLHCRTADLLASDGPELAIYPSEDLTQWPDRLRRRVARRQRAEVKDDMEADWAAVL